MPDINEMNEVLLRLIKGFLMFKETQDEYDKQLQEMVLDIGRGHNGLVKKVLEQQQEMDVMRGIVVRVALKLGLSKTEFEEIADGASEDRLGEEKADDIMSAMRELKEGDHSVN